ncbi:WxL domain-containing protein [Enterococcus sp. LJL99]
MKKGFLVATSLLAVSLIPIVASAEDGGSIESNAYISIEKNDGSETEVPVNPIEPTKPVKPVPEIDGEENPHPPSTKGPLSINYVSNLRFGNQKAQGNDAVYRVKPDQVIDDKESVIEVPNYIQITDNRGTNVGWRLTVKQNGAFKNGSNSLTGTELVFTNPTLSAKSGKADTAPTTNSTFTLTAAGQEALVMEAKAGHGMGTWIDRFGETNQQAQSSIQLKIPGDSKKVAGFYKTSLVWTLSDSPQQ